MFTIQAMSKFSPLVPGPIKSTTSFSTHFFKGRKYSISTCTSEKMLIEALWQPTLEKKIQSLKVAVKKGADINQKIENESLLKMISYYIAFDENFTPLTKTLFSLDAKVDYTEYQEGSPLHDVLFFVGSSAKKVCGIQIYTKFGVNVNCLNKSQATPLDYACYFSSNKKNRNEIIQTLRLNGAVHGFSDYYSPKRSFPSLSIPACQLMIIATGWHSSFQANARSFRLSNFKKIQTTEVHK